jgi:hypothetical protein
VDDMRFPWDYVRSCRRRPPHIGRGSSAPPFLLVLKGEDALPGAIADARAYAVDSIGLDQVETFPTRVRRTPFIPAPALVHRSAVDARIRFDEGYRGNAYREETAFFCEAVRHGFTSILTPRTVSYQTSGWRGGAHTTLLPRLRAVDDPEYRALPGPARAVAAPAGSVGPPTSRGSAVRARARAAAFATGTFAPGVGAPIGNGATIAPTGASRTARREDRNGNRRTDTRPLARDSRHGVARRRVATRARAYARPGCARPRCGSVTATSR